LYGLPTLAARMLNQQNSAMQLAEFLQRQPKVQRVVYPRLANFAQRGLAQRQMTTPDGSPAPGRMPYFELKGKNGEVRSAAEAAERFVDCIAEKSYAVTLAVRLGQIKTLVENRFSMTHALVPEEERIRSGLRGIRLSLRLEDGHDIIADLEDPRGVL
jgi:methionine-gamma-lyase